MGRRPLAVLLLLAMTTACAPAVGEVAAQPAWRWESYGGVEVSVPAGWGWGNSLQRLTQWCIAKESDKAQPLVGRPGMATLVGCSSGEATKLTNTGTTVGFGRTTAPDGVEHEGDRTTVRLDTVEVVVQAPADLRRRIAGTVRRAATDSFGCAATHVISDQPQWRPGPRASGSAVTGASVCKYQVGDGLPGTRPRLLSATHLDGPAATEALRAVAAAPVGGGPDDPASCAKSYAYGDEIVIVHGRSDLVIRYDGCDHHGFDDGSTVRTLAPAALAAFLTGPHQLP